MTSQEKQLRLQLIDYAKALNSTGLSQGKSGNISARWQDGMLITPSGVEYQQLQLDDIVNTSLGGEKCCNSLYNPSSEWHFHGGIYTARPDLQAVVHTHSSHATALACSSRNIPAFHYMVAVAGGKEIPLARYATFGTEQLSNNIVKQMTHLQACLLENHGLVASAGSIHDAFHLAQEVEELAKQYCLALSIGEINYLSDQQMDAVLEKFKTYGRSSDK